MDENESKKEMEQRVIDSFRQDETMMAMVFSQWCINNGLDPESVYREAYGTAVNPVLQEAVKLAVPKEEAGEVSSETVIQVLSLFGNDTLGEVVYKKAHMKGRDES
ncbi:hypothetical protein [Alkalicoccus urumqiensis]|uniref:Uncharacterized protein n=1 Tax=Alkalicoccus urumqiensis TaxID=1548213 RepID=A0A2P6MEY9_ALKUR|nr:hypothetical protein [Alkalicoccus urumqiensis]PRO64834.1 hypothetical protein C6I21_13060 [Alkalicoccus urumqiensis]